MLTLKVKNTTNTELATMPPVLAESTQEEGDNASESQLLEGRDVASVAKYIKSDECCNIVFLLGAGASASAGVPDFRSPDAGLEAKLRSLGIDDLGTVFDIEYFKYDPKPFYALAHDLQPGTFRPTLTHSFVRLIHEKDLLLACFTQNIDTLERQAGVPESKLIEVHGSFAAHHCIECGAKYDHESMLDAIEREEIPTCRSCEDGLVKPDIVLFGEDLPDKFSDSLDCLTSADLIIAAGTSLAVPPFSYLTYPASDRCPCVLINIRDTGSEPDDVFLPGSCDTIVEELSKELGWHEELLELWNGTQLTDAKAKGLTEQLGRS